MPRSRTMKFFHTFYLLVIAVLATLLFVERQSQTTTPSNAELSEQIENLQSQFETRFTALSDTMEDQLRDAVAQLAEQQDNYEYRRSPPSSAEQPPLDRLQDTETPTVTTPESDTLSEVEPQRPELTSGDYARLGSAIADDFNARQEAFEMQSVDPDWAYPTREQIQQLFYDDAYLRQLHVSDIECRSRLCRIDLSEADPSLINPARLLQALNQLNDDFEDGHYQLISQPQEFGYRIYVEHVKAPE